MEISTGIHGPQRMIHNNYVDRAESKLGLCAVILLAMTRSTISKMCVSAYVSVVRVGEELPWLLQLSLTCYACHSAVAMVSQPADTS